jgi:hypothetical protein
MNDSSLQTSQLEKSAQGTCHRVIARFSRVDIILEPRDIHLNYGEVAEEWRDLDLLLLQPFTFSLRLAASVMNFLQ